VEFSHPSAPLVEGRSSCGFDARKGVYHMSAEHAAFNLCSTHQVAAAWTISSMLETRWW
jgi:hypothetical protein